jgi:hypothetical protein
MAIDTDTAAEITDNKTAETNAPDSPESVAEPESEKNQEIIVPEKSNLDRTLEVPALLDMEAATDLEDAEDATVIEAEPPPADEDTKNTGEKTLPTKAESLNSSTLSDLMTEFCSIKESLKNTSSAIQNISTKADALAGDTECLIKQVNSISAKNDMLAEEIETLASGANTRGFLSKTVLIVVSTVLALLSASQIYLFTTVLRVQKVQNTAGAVVLQNISSLNKKMTVYDNHLTKALGKTDQPGHSDPGHTPVEAGGHSAPVVKEATSAGSGQVLEKLNRLRGGLPERKLIRKETGDWFIFNKKIDECISDVEVIDALNQAFQKAGKSLSPGIPLPQHNALCILKPDGKGGTEIVMTKDFVPDNDKSEKKKKM